jgi:hypothetical protein
LDTKLRKGRPTEYGIARYHVISRRRASKCGYLDGGQPIAINADCVIADNCVTYLTKKLNGCLFNALERVIVNQELCYRLRAIYAVQPDTSLPKAVEGVGADRAKSCEGMD